MNFDLVDFFVVFNPLTLVSNVVLGAFIGRVLLRRFAVFPLHILDFLLVVGTSWTALLMVVRIVQGSQVWEAYAGAMALWWVLCAAIALGYYWHRLK